MMGVLALVNIIASLSWIELALRVKLKLRSVSTIREVVGVVRLVPITTLRHRLKASSSIAWLTKLRDTSIISSKISLYLLLLCTLCQFQYFFMFVGQHFWLILLMQQTMRKPTNRFLRVSIEIYICQSKATSLVLIQYIQCNDRLLYHASQIQRGVMH